jgi:2-keto-3-deoxy-L-rhamnonate aldolase RhmA
MTMPLRERLKTGQPLVGTFIKTPAHQNVEIAALAGLGFVVLDAEHAPFAANALDVCLLACAAGHIPGIVRLLDATPASVLQALDLGASGLLVPHVSSPEQAQAIIAATRYHEGTRGFSNSPRAGRYGCTAMAEHRKDSDAEVVVIAQIEDPQAAQQICEILVTPGIDAILIGRADLAVAYGVDRLDDPLVNRAVDKVMLAARECSIPCGIFVNQVEQVDPFLAMGMQLFIIGSDQSMLMRGWSSIVSTVQSD